MRKKVGKLALVLVFIVIFIYLVVGLDLFNSSRLLEVFNKLEASDHFEIYYTLGITVLMVFFIPISWFSALGALLFGLKGYIYVIIGGLISSTIAFFIAKIFREDVQKLINKIYNRKPRKTGLEEISKGIEERGLSYIFVIRSMPFIPFGVANYVPGLTSISYKDYILGTILGVLPSQFITTYFFVRAVNIRTNPLQAVFAAIIKGVYFVSILFIRKKMSKKAGE